MNQTSQPTMQKQKTMKMMYEKGIVRQSKNINKLQVKRFSIKGMSIKLQRKLYKKIENKLRFRILFIFIKHYLISIQLLQLNILFMIKKAFGALCASAFSATCFLDGQNLKNQGRHAICILYPNNSNTRGIVSFSQQSIIAPVKIACTVKGLNPNAKHGIHIHEFGDLSQGCATAGPHYNPHNKKHGGPFEQERHLGDLGNLIADPFGNSYMCFKDEKLSLHNQHSIIGRSVVVHQNEDDLGKKGDEQSLKTGNSGPRVACGIIGLAKEFKTIPPPSS